ncbi:hypothetical protein [Phenylobacterium sp.]|uniref:hypothetical protein n=1 Tax=Phenylobacterium sp. TaxID=1871053 RepID=UPI00286C68E9|nr:hypothetical protein [Phenylobacterium sp.]
MTCVSPRRLAVALACGLGLSACASLKPKPPVPAAPPAPVITAPPATLPAPPAAKVPAPAKSDCVPKGFPRAPKYPDTDAALRDAGGAADRYQLMAAGRLLRTRRLTDLERVVDACR